MKIERRRLVFAFALITALAACLAVAPRAQQFPPYDKPLTSPPASVAGVIGGKHITIDYYAPSMHGRKIMGGLVPYGEVWATGANWATKITTPSALDIGGLQVPAGSYSIWTIPGATEWTLIINKETGQFHLDYDSSTDFGRTKMNLKKLSTPVETFRIELRPGEGNHGTLALIWETTEASVPLTILPQP
jgi:hypothetical protein